MSGLRERLFLRPIKEEDLLTVHRLERRAFRKPWTMAQLASELTLPVTSAKVLCEGGTVLGYYFASHVAGEANLNRIVVHPDYRRQGLGKQIMEAFLSESLEKQDEDAFLEVSERNEAAQALYQAFGFTVVRRRRHYYPEEMADALVMHRKIERKDHADFGD